MIYGIIVFDLRKSSGIHRKGFRMFPEMFGNENTLFGPKGKAHKGMVHPLLGQPRGEKGKGEEEKESMK